MNEKPNKIMDILVWDIETIPHITENSPVRDEKINAKLKKMLDKSNHVIDDKELEESKNMIMSTNPFFGQIIVIGSYEVSSRYPNGLTRTFSLDQRLEKEDGEKLLLKNWYEYINNFSGSFVGFNSISFDAYFTMIRSMYHNIESKNKNFFNLKKFGSWPHYDIMQHLGNWGFETRPSLGQASEFFGIPSPKIGEIAAKDVYSAYKSGRIKEIAEYCMRDVMATYDLFKITSNYI